MRLPLWVATLLLSALFTLTEAVLLHSDTRCAPDEYWCQDRCGSDAYGNTCCPTPDGQHHLCGTGTTCCMYGCCPAGTVCNAVGGCEAVPEPNTSRPGSTLLSTLTSQIVVTQIRTKTKTVTLTSSKPCPSDVSHATSGSGSASTKSWTDTSGSTERPTSKPVTSASTWTNSKGETIVSSGSAIVIGSTKTVPVPTGHTTVTSDGYTFTFGAPSASGSQPGDGASATTWTRSDGQIVISSSGIVQVGTSAPITLPTVLSLTTLTTGGETFTLSPAPTGPTGGSTGAGGGATTWTRSDGQIVVSSSGVVQIDTNPPITLPSVSSLTTITTGGETFTLSPPTPSQGSATTWTRSDGQIVVSSSGVVQIGTNAPITLPSASSLTTVTTGGETFTLSPTTMPSQGQASVTTWTRSDGQIVVSSSGVVQIGTNAPITLPSVSSLTTFTTGGETFTLSPVPITTPTQSQASATTWTMSDGQIVVSSSGVVQTGTNAPITLPSVTAPTTISTGGGVFTLFPPTSISSTTARGATGILTTTLPNGETMVSSSGVVQIGTGPPITLSETTTVTTGGGTFTWTAPGAITTSSSTATDVGPLPTFSGFPGGIFLFPLRADEVDDPEDPDDDGDDKKKGKKCIWIFFFPVCIVIPEININIEAWSFNLPPGIYPPGPPPLPKISLPPGINFKGNLPSWPAITVGPNGQPTFSSKPTNCKTETAEVCVETQSVGPSTTRFISTCIPVLGCQATDEATTTTTSCVAVTVTSFAVSCAAGSSSSCTTLTSVISSGCSASGTTSTTLGSCALLRTSTIPITELIPACDVLSTSTISIAEIEPAFETTTSSTSTAAGPTTDTNTNTIMSTTTIRPEFDSTVWTTVYYTITSTPGMIFPRQTGVRREV